MAAITLLSRAIWRDLAERPIEIDEPRREVVEPPWPVAISRARTATPFAQQASRRQGEHVLDRPSWRSNRAELRRRPQTR